MENVTNFNDEYVWPVQNFANTWIETECKNSCRHYKYLVHEREIVVGKSYSGAIVKFTQKVVITQTSANYNLFQFLIDVGSSLGLWLGLSVLGFHDLVVRTLQFVKNSVSFKKFKTVW